MTTLWMREGVDSENPHSLYEPSGKPLYHQKVDPPSERRKFNTRNEDQRVQIEFEESIEKEDTRSFYEIALNFFGF